MDFANHLQISNAHLENERAQGQDRAKDGVDSHAIRDTEAKFNL